MSLRRHFVQTGFGLHQAMPGWSHSTAGVAVGATEEVGGRASERKGEWTRLTFSFCEFELRKKKRFLWLMID